MNRGSALKWAAEVEAASRPMNDGSCLRDTEGFCLTGILEDFVQNGEWGAAPFGSYATTEGRIGFVSKSTLARCKAKTDLAEAQAFYEANRALPPSALAEWIRRNGDRL